ncbi:helix-turn-helix domain-containing protein [Phyllobacterium sp. OV277]|uniref:helix-turn-helix domain-containing protein n=1 Tax=Phyllobacterium sp. OV277 TaxID=1882772 RepID=UPI00088A79B5|nr:helix-turn-helix domain-containing protein [Phyllobacterium sp. OV277]SDO57152.1 DNA binding domain-containing protein, excisionase family [Phyllobacterium sp. OV277]
MARRAHGRALRLHRNYTVDEAARVLGVAEGSIRRWIKNGLPALQERKPALILGGDLSEFLKSRKATKRKCKLNECYCFSCRVPRQPAFGEVEFLPLNATSGNMRAICEECSTLMHKRVSVMKLDELKAILAVTITQGKERINKHA